MMTERTNFLDEYTYELVGEQPNSYRENGFLIIKNLFSVEECDAILKIVYDHAEEKFQKKKCILADICNRMTQNNPLANLFLGIVENKLGNRKEGDRRQQLAVEYLSYSAYWQERFGALGLDKLCRDVE